MYSSFPFHTIKKKKKEVLDISLPSCWFPSLYHFYCKARKEVGESLLVTSEGWGRGANISYSELGKDVNKETGYNPLSSNLSSPDCCRQPA